MRTVPVVEPDRPGAWTDTLALRPEADLVAVGIVDDRQPRLGREDQRPARPSSARFATWWAPRDPPGRPPLVGPSSRSPQAHVASADPRSRSATPRSQPRSGRHIAESALDSRPRGPQDGDGGRRGRYSTSSRSTARSRRSASREEPSRQGRLTGRPGWGAFTHPSVATLTYLLGELQQVGRTSAHGLLAAASAGGRLRPCAAWVRRQSDLSGGSGVEPGRSASQR